MKKLFSFRFLLYGSIFFFLGLPFLGAFVLGVDAKDDWKNAEKRTLNQSLSGWHVPKIIGLTGTTTFKVTLSDGAVQRLDESATTSGASIQFVGSTGIPTKTLLIWHGTGKSILPNTGSSSPIVYVRYAGGVTNFTNGAWPFPTNTNANYTYMAEVISGIYGPGGVTGATVYFISGVTLY